MNISNKTTFGICTDSSNLTRFIEDNSDMTWNDAIDLAREAFVYGDEGSEIGSITYQPEDKWLYSWSSKEELWQSLVNKFYEAYNLDKTKPITLLNE